MSNKIFIADYANKVVREKATMEKPFCHYTKERQIIGCNELGGQYGSHKPCICKPYNDHLASLKSYPATWLTPEMDGKELVDGKDFELKKEKLRTDEIETPFGTIYDDIFGDTIAIALPSQPEQNRGQEYFKNLDEAKLTKPMSNRKEDWQQYFINNIDKTKDKLYIFNTIWEVATAPTPVSSEEGKDEKMKALKDFIADQIMRRNNKDATDNIFSAVCRLLLEQKLSTPSTPQGEQSLVDFIKENFYTKGQCGEDNEPLTVEQIVASWQSLSSESSGAVEKEKLADIELGKIIKGLVLKYGSWEEVASELKSKFHLTRKQ